MPYVFQSYREFSQREGEGNEEWERLKEPNPHQNLPLL